jgi:hypothetical protein
MKALQNFLVAWLTLGSIGWYSTLSSILGRQAWRWSNGRIAQRVGRSIAESGGSTRGETWEDSLSRVVLYHSISDMCTLHRSPKTSPRKNELQLQNHAWVSDIQGSLTIDIIVDYIHVWELINELQLLPEVVNAHRWRLDSTGQYSSKSGL